jgi:hypothetical protein
MDNVLMWNTLSCSSFFFFIILQLFFSWSLSHSFIKVVVTFYYTVILPLFLVGDTCYWTALLGLSDKFIVDVHKPRGEKHRFRLFKKEKEQKSSRHLEMSSKLQVVVCCFIKELVSILNENTSDHYFCSLYMLRLTLLCILCVSHLSLSFVHSKERFHIYIRLTWSIEHLF